MPAGKLFQFGSWVLLIEFVGALLIVGYVLAAAVVLLRRRSIDPARLLVADGVVAGLNFKLAATVLKTVMLKSWEQILLFAVILCIRTLVKRVLAWEHGRLARQATALTR